MKKYISLLLIAALLFGLSAHAEEFMVDEDEVVYTQEELHAMRQETFDRLFQMHKVIGGAVVLFQNGNIVDSFYYGTADMADKSEVDENTVFRIASVTKMVTAIGVMKLVEEGKIDLDGDIGSYFGFTVRNPAYPDIPVTVRQLMTHTSGLQDCADYTGALYGEKTALSYIFSKHPKRAFNAETAPGTTYSYSNFGGGILGSLIEQVSGETLDDYMTENIFAPLSITAAYRPALFPEGTKLAKIYDYETGKLTKNLYTEADTVTKADPDYDFTYSAGKLCITANDLAKLSILLCGDGTYQDERILEKDTVKAMRTVQNGIGSVTGNSDHGLSLNIFTNELVQGRTVYGHQGKAYEMICSVYFDPVTASGVVLLTNGCDINYRNGIPSITRNMTMTGFSILTGTPMP